MRSRFISKAHNAARHYVMRPIVHALLVYLGVVCEMRAKHGMPALGIAPATLTHIADTVMVISLINCALWVFIFITRSKS